MRSSSQAHPRHAAQRLMAGGLILGCALLAVPVARAEEAPAAPRDYFFPPTSTAKWVYDYHQIVTTPAGTEQLKFVETVTIVRHAGDTAQLKHVLTQPGVPGDAPTVTYSTVTSLPRGRVRLEGPLKATFGPEVFTAAGSTEPAGTSTAASRQGGGTVKVTTKSDAVRTWCVGEEYVQVPAGIYACKKLVNSQGHTRWYAPGLGLVKVSMPAALNMGAVSIRQEVVLRSFHE